MSIYVRRRLRILPGLYLNLTRTGASVSGRAGRVTVNSRGRASVRLGRGLSWRGCMR